MPAYHMAPSLLTLPAQELPGAHQPYTAVLEARPAIRAGTQDSGRGRTISRKRSRRWEPTAFPRRSHPASSALALPSLTYKGAYLFGASLEGAYLLGVWVDSKTVLNNAVIDDQTQLGDIQWGGVG